MMLSAARRAGDAGGRLDSGIRAFLEPAFGTDLSGVRVHCGPRTDAFLRSRRLTAAAAGHRVWLPTPDQFRAPGRGSREQVGQNWLRILAHEVAHTIQQASGLGQAAADCEAGADLAAAAVVAGQPVPAGWLPAGTYREAPRAGHGTVVLAGFNSWEHQLLGDLTGEQLVAIADKRGDQVIASMLAMLQLWVPGNPGITPDQLRAAMPGITVVTLPNTCVATYGEICALADFIADTDALSLPADYVFPILQQIRQETCNRLLALSGGKPPVVGFGRSIAPYVPPGGTSAEKAGEVLLIDMFSAPLGRDHYKGLLARNACHFAPFAWYRWKEARATAISTATEAMSGSGPVSGQLTDLAWAQLAYAEHFVQDCFAPGHLTNKTLVMQYFLDWVGKSWIIPIKEWESVREVTLARQPDLWGPQLYDDDYLMLWSNDPQSAEEQPTFTQRADRTGVTGYGSVTKEQAYHQYLAFLRSSVVQLSSNQVHNHFNINGLYVSSSSSGQPYQIYGDENLLKTPAQVGVMAPVLDDFREAVRQVFRGNRPPKPEEVLRQLPQLAGSDASKLSLLKSWNTGELKKATGGIFTDGWAKIADLATALISPTMGVVSVDQLVGGMQQDWSVSLPGTWTVTVHWDGQRLFAGAYGTVYELSPANGSIIAQNPLSEVSNYYTVSFSSDGETLFAGKNGYVFALPAANISKARAMSERLDLTWSTVEQLLTDDGHLYVSAVGYLYELNRRTLAKLHNNKLSGRGTFDARFAASGNILVVGIHGQVLCLKRDDLTTQIGNDAPMSTPQELNVAVLSVSGQVWAACARTLGQVNLADGGFSKLTTDPSSHGLARLAVSGDKLLHVVNGTLYIYDLPTGKPAGQVVLSPTGVPIQDSSPGNILTVGGNVFAAANGYVYRIDPVQAKILNPDQVPIGDKAEVRMASDGIRLFCGITKDNACRVVSFLLTQPAA